ncbi:MAG: dTDP-4-dehydrorhamnose 3,5-epimerase [Candidatus Omnitrophica bacterium]|nr:dTDP-4-dehydrorhamnose 3,5-epimerase [Candidatus Omnitrophota bacterium]
MKYYALDIPDVMVIEPRVYEDERGFFYESYRQSFFSDLGIRDYFVQDNHCRSQKGVLRGLHFQVAPCEQAKLVRCVEGKIFDVVVDIRPDSKTFGKYASVELSAENKKILYVPIGFAHGYLALEDGTEVLYKVTAIWSPSHERGIVWNDPDVKISWPKLEKSYVLSERDQKYPTLKEYFQ